MVDKLPLDAPEFHNPWDPEFTGKAADAAWKGVLDEYYAGRLAEAAEALGQMLSQGYDEIAVRRSLAAVYKDMGRHAQAAAEYARIAALLPEDPHVLIDWGFALLADGDVVEAALRFEEALRLDDHEKWAHFGLGVARLVLGETDLGIRGLTQAVSLDRNLAAAYELLGMAYLQRGEYLGAITTLYRSIRLDSSYLPTYFHLATAYHKAGRLTEAWEYYDRSARIFSSRADIQEHVAGFVEAHREFVMAVEEGKRAESRRLAHIKVTPLPGTEEIPSIRVGLLEKASTITFSAGSAFTLRSLGGGPRVEERLSPGVWEARREGSRLVLTGPGAAVVSVEADGVRLQLAESDTTFIIYDLDAGQGYFWARREDRQVRGDLEILLREEGLTLVNELDIESYLLAVVPSEMYAAMPIEALKAQAIAARTYALRSVGRYRSRGFDVLGSVASTAYKGVEREHPNTTQAVMETAGEVLTHRGRLAETLYSSSAGGHTASGEEVWGGKTAYLLATPEWGSDERGPSFPLAPATLEKWLKYVPDVYSSRSEIGLQSTFRWVQRVPAEEIEARVRPYASIGEVVALIPGERSIGGYVSRVTIVGTAGSYVVQGDRIRSMLGGLKSNAFKIETLPGLFGSSRSFLIFGAGFGHGVGLSQFGAAGMAEAGMSASQILRHYYADTEIRPRYNR